MLHPFVEPTDTGDASRRETVDNEFVKKWVTPFRRIVAGLELIDADLLPLAQLRFTTEATAHKVRVLAEEKAEGERAEAEAKRRRLSRMNHCHPGGSGKIKLVSDSKEGDSSEGEE